MFTNIGKVALKFVIAYGFLSSLFVTMFTAYNITPPDLLLVMPFSAYKFVSSLPSLSSGLFFYLYIFAIFGVFIMDLVVKLVAGLPVLFYKLAMLSGYPWLAVPMTSFALFLQFSAYIAGYNMFISYLRGTTGG